MSPLAAWIVRMYLAATLGNPCTAGDLAWADFHAAGVCSFDTDSEDGECTEEGSAVLQTLFFMCHPADDYGE